MSATSYIAVYPSEDVVYPSFYLYSYGKLSCKLGRITSKNTPMKEAQWQIAKFFSLEDLQKQPPIPTNFLCLKHYFKEMLNFDFENFRVNTGLQI
jgi:hypothetical protein